MITQRLCRAPRQAFPSTCSARNPSIPWKCLNRPRNIHLQADSSHLPRIVQPTIWESVFPKSLRETTKATFRPSSRRPANPASYFIWIYILIGSQAIRILSLQNEHNTYVRRADLQLDKLREVVQKLQNGEEVDVEKVLGVGDEEQEEEWELALREIENEERTWQEGRKKSEADKQKADAERVDASPVSVAEEGVSKVEGEGKIESAPDLPATIPKPPGRPGFY